jgi:hypothetical protein
VEGEVGLQIKRVSVPPSTYLLTTMPRQTQSRLASNAKAYFTEEYTQTIGVRER